jgi:hypothetical protein
MAAVVGIVGAFFPPSFFGIVVGAIIGPPAGRGVVGAVCTTATFPAYGGGCGVGATDPTGVTVDVGVGAIGLSTIAAIPIFVVFGVFESELARITRPCSSAWIATSPSAGRVPHPTANNVAASAATVGNPNRGARVSETRGRTSLARSIGRGLVLRRMPGSYGRRGRRICARKRGVFEGFDAE